MPFFLLKYIKNIDKFILYLYFKVTKNTKKTLQLKLRIKQSSTKCLPVIVNSLGVCFSEWNLFNFDKICDGWTKKSRRHWIQVLAILGNFSDNFPKPWYWKISIKPIVL